MSTRCHILFEGREQSILTYKHHDGYPEEIIPQIRTYWQWNGGAYVDYFTATWFYYCKRQVEDMMKRKYEDEFNEWPIHTAGDGNYNPLTGGYGICIDNNIQGDTEHLYIVNINNKIIEHYMPTDSSWFDSEPLEEIVSRDPNAVYSLNNDKIENLSPRMVEREVVLKQGRKGEDRDVIQNSLTKAAPICQADDCTNVAVHVRSSLEGHPNGEWKLCREHFNEVDGKDPWYNEERDWTLKKLYYRCPNGGQISHNPILKYEDEGGYPCSCGERHLPQKPDATDLDGVPQ